MSKAVIVLAEGFEEIEAITPIDLLRRGGVSLIVAGLDRLTVRGKRGLVVTCDALLSGVAPDWDALVLPGGMPGAKNLSESELLIDCVRSTLKRGARIAAICAAPAEVLGRHGFLTGRKFTGFPGTEKAVLDAFPQESAVVIDGLFLTSKAAGTASEFALTLLGLLEGTSTAKQVAHDVLLPEPRLEDF